MLLLDFVVMFAGVFVGVEDGLDNVVFVVVVEYSGVLFFMGKSKDAGFSLSMETLSCLPFYGEFEVFGVSFIYLEWSGVSRK